MPKSLMGRSKRSLRAMGPLDLTLAVVTGVLLGIGAGLPLAQGDGRPVLFAVVLMCLITLICQKFVPTAHRPRLILMFMLALALRFAVAVLLQQGSLAVGQGGFVTGDDRSYATLAWAFAEYVRGNPLEPYVPPTWNTEVYLFGTYVYLESAIFLMFGEQVLLMMFVNGAAMVIAAILLFDVSRRLFGDTAAAITAVAMSFFPSLVLWSSINLKDAVALLLITAILWLLFRFQSEGTTWFLIAAVVLLVPMESLRRYVFLLLAGIAPVAVLVARNLGPGKRLLTGTLMITVCGLLIVNNLNQDSWYRPTFEVMEQVRHNMGVGARTSFQRPSPIPVKAGDTFRVVVAGSELRDTLEVKIVPLESRIVLLRPEEPEPPATAGVSYVRPGDKVIMSSSANETPVMPAATERPLVLPYGGPNEGSSDSLRPAISFSGQDAPTRTLNYLPVGIAHALFAPFPWALKRTIELLTVPEILLWYGLLIGAAVSVWRSRPLWRNLAPILLFTGGVLAVFSLVEGNYGTLIRHRAMVIPFVIMLAAPSLVTLARRRAQLSRWLRLTS